jgi:hypothetical protein
MRQDASWGGGASKHKLFALKNAMKNVSLRIKAFSNLFP